MQTQKNVLAYSALVVVCIVWGTTYLATRIGVQTIPPFLFSAVRQCIAGVTLIMVLKAMGKFKMDRSIVFQQLILGLLLIAIANGLLSFSQQYIPSGLAALIVSILPIFFVGINYFSGIDKTRPNGLVYVGLILGTLGVLLIFQDNVKDLANPSYILGMMVAFASCLAWGLGSVYAKKVIPKGNMISSASIQMVIGGLALFVMSYFLDDYSQLSLISTKSIWGLGYVIVFGSLIAYSAYVYCLEKLPIGVVSVYAYVNPLIAILLGNVLIDEPVTFYTFMAFFCIAGAIYFINKGYKK